MSRPNQANKRQQVADLIKRLGLGSSDRDEPRTAVQINRKTYYKIQRGRPSTTGAEQTERCTYNRSNDHNSQRPRTSSQTNTPRPQLPKPTQPTPPRQMHQHAATKTMGGPSHMTPREPATVPGTSGVHLTKGVRMKTDAQQASNRRKFHQLKEKRKSRELMAREQHRLAKQPGPTSDPEATSQPPSQPTPPMAMEVDLQATEDGMPENWVQSTTQA